MSKARRGHGSKPKSPRKNKGKKPYPQLPVGLAGGLGKGPGARASNGPPKTGGDSTVSARSNRKGRRESDIARGKNGGDSGKLLTSDDPAVLAEDMRMLRIALTKGYNIRNKELMRKRAEEILRKETGEVMTKHGLVVSETKGDELALEAIKVLTKMDEADLKRIQVMKEIHKEGQPGEGQPQFGVNINVNGNGQVSINADDKRSSLIMLARRFGASELVIDDQPVMEDGSNQEAIDVSGNEVES